MFYSLLWQLLQDLHGCIHTQFPPCVLHTSLLQQIIRLKQDHVWHLHVSLASQMHIATMEYHTVELPS